MDAVSEYLDGDMPEARAWADYEESDEAGAIIQAKQAAAHEAVDPGSNALAAGPGPARRTCSGSLRPIA